MKKLTYSLIISLASMICLFACGGGGGGSGQAGDKASLRILNAITNNDSIAVSIDGTMFFPQILKGQASAYEEINAGTSLVEAIDNSNPLNKAELFNEFSKAMPYTLVFSGQSDSIKPIIALNDRSDTPQAQFRIRAINAKTSGLPLEIKMIPASFRLRDDIETTDSTPTATPTVTPAAILTPTVTATPEEQTPTPATEVTIVTDLGNGVVSAYRLLARGDYRIQVREGNQLLYLSQPITYNPNQIESIVVSDLDSVVARLNDKP